MDPHPKTSEGYDHVSSLYQIDIYILVRVDRRIVCPTIPIAHDYLATVMSDQHVSVLVGDYSEPTKSDISTERRYFAPEISQHVW